MLKINTLNIEPIKPDNDRIINTVSELHIKRKHLLEERSHIDNEITAVNAELDQMKPDIRSAYELLGEYL